MTVRSTGTSVTFRAPFRLPGFDRSLPAGNYAVDTEEEAIEGNVRTVFRRVATTLIVETAGRIEHRAVDPQDLEAALQRDQEAMVEPPEAQAPDPSIVPPSSRGWVPSWIRVLWSGRGA